MSTTIENVGNEEKEEEGMNKKTNKFEIERWRMKKKKKLKIKYEANRKFKKKMKETKKYEEKNLH